MNRFSLLTNCRKRKQAPGVRALEILSGRKLDEVCNLPDNTAELVMLIAWTVRITFDVAAMMSFTNGLRSSSKSKTGTKGEKKRQDDFCVSRGSILSVYL